MTYEDVSIKDNLLKDKDWIRKEKTMKENKTETNNLKKMVT